MKTAVRVALFCVALSQAVHAQPLAVGQSFPLTNTRYGGRPGAPVLATNGSDFLLAWGRPEAIYVSPVSGPATPGRPILTTNGYTAAGIRHDVVWTGTRFLVAATRLNAGGSFAIFGRLLTASGEADGAEFLIADDARDPRLAFNGVNILMVYKAGLPNRVMSLLLGSDGRPAAPAVWASTLDTFTYDVAANGSDFLIAALAETILHTVVVDARGAARTAMVFRDIGIADTSRDALALIATDGGFFAVHRDSLYRVRAMKFDPAGRFIFGGWNDQDISRGPISVTKLGDGVAVAAANYDQTNVRLLRVDRAGNVVPEVISSPTGASLTSVAAAGGKVLVAWTDSEGAIRVGNDETIRSYGAADQNLELMTSSGDGALVVWSERTKYRAGVRTPLGDWKEIALPGGVTPIAVAAGGGQFAMVVRKSLDVYSVFRWSSSLEPIGSEIAIPDIYRDRGIVIGWVGNGFVIVGPDWPNGNIVMARLLSPSGALTAPKKLFEESYSFDDVSFAFSGDTFILAWKAQFFGGCIPEDCDFLFFKGLHALRVRSDLGTVDDHTIEVASYKTHVETAGGVAWDGNAFVVLWKDSTGLHTRRVPKQGAMESPSDVSGSGNVVAGGAIAAIPGGIAIALGQRIASFGGGVAYASSEVQFAPPYYGASRLLMTIGDVALPQLPDAPKLSGGLTADGTAILTWTKPPQETNGYRVEVRGANGAWTEIEQWLSAANARLLQIRVEGPASFRVRAWNDAGVSVYSNEVTPAFARRRSAR